VKQWKQKRANALNRYQMKIWINRPQEVFGDFAERGSGFNS
jgi:hypothetical protein